MKVLFLLDFVFCVYLHMNIFLWAGCTTVRRTVAGAPSSQLPIRDTPSTSSSSFGMLGTPASNGTIPTHASSSVALVDHRVLSMTSTQVDSRHTSWYQPSRAPAGCRQILPDPTATPAQDMLGKDGRLATGVPGPTFRLVGGGSARSIESSCTDCTVTQASHRCEPG